MKLFSYKNFFNYFIIFYFLILAIFSLKVGITHDEPHHNLVWEINKKIYSNFFLNTNYDIIFPDYGMTFYGIGFQMFSIPLEVESVEREYENSEHSIMFFKFAVLMCRSVF